MTLDEMIAMVEQSRERMHKSIDEKYDAMIACMRTGQPFQPTGIQRLDLAGPLFLFKGKKPMSIIYPNGEQVVVSTWREVAKELLRDCNSDPDRHNALMQLRNVVSGNKRWILSDSSQQMNVGIKIDDDLYFEGKFDTEYLLKMLTEKIFDVVGYPYQMIEIEVREKDLTVVQVEEPTMTGLC